MDSVMLDYVYPNSFTVLSHPFTLAKTLMQLGHEPDPPFLSSTFWSMLGMGERRYRYPSVFTYLSTLSGSIGVGGVLTTGLCANLLHVNTHYFVTDQMLKNFSEGNTRKPHVDTEADIDVFIRQVGELTLARVTGAVISYPFQVIMIRQIAQICGGETYYRTIFHGVSDVFVNEGLRGFFGGLSAHLIEEVLSLWGSLLFAHVFNKYVLQDKAAPDLKSQMPTVGKMVVSFISYKYRVISVNMACSGSRLKLAMPFINMNDCHTFLASRSALDRGSSMFRRFVCGPI